MSGKKERNQPKNQDLTIREFSKQVSKAKPRQIKQKHMQTGTRKHQTNTNHQNNSSLPIVERKPGKHQTRHTKKKKKKNGQHLPLEQGLSKRHLCDSTGRLASDEHLLRPQKPKQSQSQLGAPSIEYLHAMQPRQKQTEKEGEETHNH